MLIQYLKRRRKILTGLFKTFVRGERTKYEPGSWWDDTFFVDGLSDRQTISPRKDALTAAYHYASVELLILRHLRNTGAPLEGASVCDLGAGSGHWIDFYLALGASRCVGIDISRKAVDHLEDKYSANDRVTIHHGRAGEILRTSRERFDLINAIGVMFHLVDDAEWRDTLADAAARLDRRGILVVGGHFGWIDGVNVQFDEEGTVNKRLRSARNWRRTLAGLGFEEIRFLRNPAYLFVNDSLPENNVLIARKR